MFTHTEKDKQPTQPSVMPPIGYMSASSAQQMDDISPVDQSVKSSKGRGYHDFDDASGPVLVMVGGLASGTLIAECWICDTSTMLWKKV